MVVLVAARVRLDDSISHAKGSHVTRSADDPSPGGTEIGEFVAADGRTRRLSRAAPAPTDEPPSLSDLVSRVSRDADWSRVMAVRTFARVAFPLQRFEVLTAIAATAVLVVAATLVRSLLDAAHVTDDCWGQYFLGNTGGACGTTIRVFLDRDDQIAGLVATAMSLVPLALAAFLELGRSVVTWTPGRPGRTGRLPPRDCVGSSGGVLRSSCSR